MKRNVNDDDNGKKVKKLDNKDDTIPISSLKENLNG